MAKQIIPLEVWSEESNLAIVRMPGRQYPGAVLQGDTLMSLVANAKRVHDLAKALNSNELLLATGNLLFDLREILEFYSEVCDKI